MVAEGQMPVIAMLQPISADDYESVRDSSSPRGVDYHVSDSGRRVISLGTTWHGLHFLFTAEAGDTGFPAGFLAPIQVPARETPGRLEEHVRIFSPAQVQTLHGWVQTITEGTLQARFDAERMEALAVYPKGWTEAPEVRLRDLLAHFRALRAILRRAAGDGFALVVYIN